MCLAIQSCPAHCDPMDCIPPGSSVHRILQARILEWVATLFSRRSSHPGIKPGSPALQANCLLSEPPAKLKNTLVRILSRLQGVVPTQESNQALLHCRQILYQSSYPGSKPQESSPLFMEGRIHVFCRLVNL